MKNPGMTLVEVMFAVSILSIVLGALFAFSLGFGDTTQVQEIQATSHDEVRRALNILMPDIRQAVRSTINWDALPGEILQYRTAADVSGNGTAVDVNGRLELGPQRVVSRDTNDANGDGFTDTQLIVIGARGVQVLANNLSPDNERPDANGVFGPAQDSNGNGQLDCGIWFEPWGQGIRITIQTQGQTRQGQILRTTLQEVVIPRN